MAQCSLETKLNHEILWKFTLGHGLTPFGWFYWERPTDLCAGQTCLINIFKPFNLPRGKFTNLHGGGVSRLSLLPNWINYSGGVLFNRHLEMSWVPVRICYEMIYTLMDLGIYNFLTISPSEAHWILRNTDGQRTFVWGKTTPASSLP